MNNFLVSKIGSNLVNTMINFNFFNIQVSSTCCDGYNYSWHI